MRKKLFEENYQLLKKIVPELLVGTYEDIDFHFNRDVEIKDGRFIYGTWAERTYINDKENHLIIGTFYFFKDGHKVETGKDFADFVSDPELTVLFNNETGIARLVNFYNNNPYTSMLNGGFPSEVTFNCTENSEEKDKEERELNNYLNKMLKEIVKEQKNNKNYWTKIER